MKLPFYILKSLQDSKTSLGQHPSYPPDEEDSFIIGTVSDYFNHLSDGIVYNDINELKLKFAFFIGITTKKAQRIVVITPAIFSFVYFCSAVQIM